MQKIIIFSGCFLLLLLASCKKDEYVNNKDTIIDTVVLVADPQPQEYDLYDDIGLYINATTPNAISYQWLPTNETTPVIEFVPNNHEPAGWNITRGDFFGGYEVTITLPDTIIHRAIAVFADKAVVYCANSFTPNGDGLNDFWCVYYNDNAVRINSLTIFNSSNTKVFHSGENEDPLWNGMYKHESCLSGTYYYTVHFTTVQGKKKSKAGLIELTGR
jgi:gliding motility-associated-like protein